MTMTPRTATLIGLSAILMWSLLSVMTVATGKIPAFQLAAMTFAIGAVICALRWIGRVDAVKALAGLFQAEQTTTHRSDDFRLATNHPALGSWRRQIGDRERTSVGPDDVLHPRAVGFGHVTLTHWEYDTGTNSSGNLPGAA